MLLRALLVQLMILILQCSANGRILGGELVTKDSKMNFPHHLQLGWQHSDRTPNIFCGGTLIAAKVVLTACHCIVNLTTCHYFEDERPGKMIQVFSGMYTLWPSATRKKSKAIWAAHEKCCLTHRKKKWSFDIGAGALFKDLTGKYAKVLSRVHYLETGSKGFVLSLKGRKIYATGMGACFREDNDLSLQRRMAQLELPPKNPVTPLTMRFRPLVQADAVVPAYGDSGGAIVMIKKELSFGRTKYQYVILAVAVASKLNNSLLCRELPDDLFEKGTTTAVAALDHADWIKNKTGVKLRPSRRHSSAMLSNNFIVPSSYFAFVSVPFIMTRASFHPLQQRVNYK